MIDRFGFSDPDKVVVACMLDGSSVQENEQAHEAKNHYVWPIRRILR